MNATEIIKSSSPSESQHTAQAVDQKKASDLDTRGSEVCTRAGLTALLFSALAVSMLQPLTKQPAFDALEKYIALRFVLKSSLDDLDADPCWQDLRSGAQGDEASNTWNLSQLLAYRCSSKPRGPDTELKLAGLPPEESSGESSPQSSGLPTLRPLTGLKLVY